MSSSDVIKVSSSMMMASPDTRAVKGDDAEHPWRPPPSSSAAWNWMRRFRDVGPVTLQIEGGPASARLYCDAVDGLAEGGDLVEAFLVEIFRCKLCRFTCALKSAICSHLLLAHASLEEAGLQRPQLAYPLDLKHHDENDDFLLYDVLQDIGPPACHSLKVGELFEDHEPVSSHADRRAHQETAQSAHLMTLGLCRIAAARPPSETAGAPKPTTISVRAHTAENAGKYAERRRACRRVSGVRQRAELKSAGRMGEEPGQKGAESHELTGSCPAKSRCSATWRFTPERKSTPAGRAHTPARGKSRYGNMSGRTQVRSLTSARAVHTLPLIGVLCCDIPEHTREKNPTSASDVTTAASRRRVWIFMCVAITRAKRFRATSATTPAQTASCF
ncbi:uncharacterized protein LOC130929672 isoform X4 [Corythoichthys intestinalis]|uniref:uncharacterized protein LOC130929672 isoform X4 n=1 Tax=Corythoichthys intestinalis TaxID=161448 RepID=UPI0025A65665|nr:uncharacterized protein LOC130929672 isoform X4 [Corythoichthys intestinalis]